MLADRDRLARLYEERVAGWTSMTGSGSDALRGRSAATWLGPWVRQRKGAAGRSERGVWVVCHRASRLLVMRAIMAGVTWL
jgi:hypothetical protein